MVQTQYIPHGHCYLWQTPLVWLHLSSDLFIALAYYSIPVVLIYFIYRRREVPFRSIFALFSAFIVSCGTTHLVEIWTLWHADYWFSGFLKALTALISVYTAIELVSLIPQAIALPSPSELEKLNDSLQEEIKNREKIHDTIRNLNKELEIRVFNRTQELEITNQQLRQEIAERQQIEESLKASKKFTEKITNLTPQWIYVYDIIENKNIYTNQFITEILGFERENTKQIDNQTMNILVHPEDKPRLLKHHEECLYLKDEDKIEIEYRIRDNKNRWHWLNSKKTVFERMPNGITKQVVGCAIDITERKNAELELQSLSQQLSQRVQELEQNTQETIQMGKITDFLQACSTVTEALTALPDLLNPLLKESSGAVMMFNYNTGITKTVAKWGDNLKSKLTFNFNECWGLRRTETYQGDGDCPNLCCYHIEKSADPIYTLCLPMITQGSIIGMIYLNFHRDKRIMESKKCLAETVTKQISIALANLQLRENLEKHSFQDPLTGIYNRRYMEIQLEQQIKQAYSKREKLGLIIVDIDFFKKINDTYGHEGGDLVLRTIGEYLQKNSPSSHIICRYGGEEFVVIVPEASTEELLKTAEYLRDLIKKLSIQYDNLTIENITASFGVSWVSANSTSIILIERLFKLADQALYEAKKQGRDRVIYLPDHTKLTISPPDSLDGLNANSFLRNSY